MKLKIKKTAKPAQGRTKPPRRPKLPRVKMPRLRRDRGGENKFNQALENLPRITNETVAEHREEMLSSARKFIYPLQHSRQYIVKISVALFAVGIVVFAAYIALALYKVQSSSSFIYGVTRVLPLPVAKAGNAWVSYESYLFELRHFQHYYETQQEVDFSTDNGKTQLDNFKQRSLQQVIDDAYVKQLARQHGVSVSDRDVSDAVTLLRNQNRLGTNDQEFADVLKEFWGWSPDDFRRELRQQLLAQKVVAKLDSRTAQRAAQAEAQLKGGADFAALAAKLSDDQNTKANGGEYGFQIDRSSRDLPPKLVDALYHLQPGQTSDVIDTGYSLEIVKLISVSGGKLRAAHISFNYQPISQFIGPLEKKDPPKRYITVATS